MAFNVIEIEENETRPQWKGTPVVFDGDEIAYVCAAGNEVRKIRVREKVPFSQWKEYDKRTDFYKDVGGKAKAENFIIEDVQLPFKIDKAYAAVDDWLSNVLKTIETDQYKGFLASGSPRDKIATIQVYKGNREGLIRPKQLKKVRQYLIDRWGFEEIDGSQYETDDYVSIYASKYGYIAAVNDKDQYQCGNTWLMKPSMSEPVWLTEFGFFDFKKQGSYNKPIGEGECFLAYQCLCGDSSDNYKGTKLTKATCGEVKAKKIITPCTTYKELWTAVADTFKGWYPEPFEYAHAYTGEVVEGTWHSVFDEIYRLAYMARDFDSWKTGYDVLKEIDYDLC